MRARRTVALAASAAAALVVAGGVTLALLPHQTVPHPPASAGPVAAHTAAPSSAPVALATPAPAATAKTTTGATAVAASFLTSADSLTGKTIDPADFAGVAAGTALNELQAGALELRTNGWHVTGTPVLRDVKVLHESLSAPTPTATVQVCVDSSHVVMRDADGKPVNASIPGTHRALNLFGLRYEHGAWRVVTHSFPTDPAC